MNSVNTPYFSDWPQICSAIKVDPKIEQAVAKIVGQMTVEEKVGQMIQPDLRAITVQEMMEYKIGSILNGGGAWPDENKHAAASDWVAKADAFWQASEQMFADRPFRIPFIWATDAVHGHNNVYGATVFPHNIGLGCTRDPELIRRIGRITAIEIAATGLDWTFAPTVATPRNLRWGRVYEGYSEDPEVVYAYAAEMVNGLQGDAAALKGEQHVLSNVKHWVGDGGTYAGVDRGVNGYSEELLRNIHAMGYFSGLQAGAQVVMSSFNSWDCSTNYDHSPDIEGDYNFKLHGSKYLLTDVLKEKMGFDGLVVTDWHGHSEVSKCSDGDASYAINAGNDILMVPVKKHWKAVYSKTVADIATGVIPMARIDDAVTRILRVKMRAGLWAKPCPSQRALAANQSLLGHPEHRQVAREAVRKSLVLLKNKDGILPLAANQKVLLTGSAADDLQKQAGGWNLTWQGDENVLADFPGATTVKMALEAELGAENVIYDPDLNCELKAGDIAIVVFGEDPYAEMMGDIKPWQTLEFATLKRSYKADVERIRTLHQAGVKVISVFFSGRPLYMNQQIAQSDAFIAAFLPGSEGEGITDLMVADADGRPRFDFSGTLSFSWPNRKRSDAVNRIPPHIPDYQLPQQEQDPSGEHKPLFAYGYGLNYSDRQQEADLDNLLLDEDTQEQSRVATRATHLYGIQATIGDYQLKVADALHPMGVDVSRNNPIQLDSISTRPYNYQQQQDAVELMISEKGAVYVQPGDGGIDDLSHYDNSKGYIVFDVKVLRRPCAPVWLTLQKVMDEQELKRAARAEITAQLTGPLEQFVTVRVPCSELSRQGIDFRYLDTPFMLFSEGNLHCVIANIRWDIVQDV